MYAAGSMKGRNYRSFVQMPVNQNTGVTAVRMTCKEHAPSAVKHLWHHDSKIKNAVPMSVHIKRMLDGTNDDKQK
jgi:hypothetical protein